MMHP
jgi:hypothetical protein